MEQARCLSQDNEPRGAAWAWPSACSPVSHALTDSAVRASSLGRERKGGMRAEHGNSSRACRMRGAGGRWPTRTPVRLLPLLMRCITAFLSRGPRRAAGGVTVHLRHESEMHCAGKMSTWVTREELLCGSVRKLACSNNISSRWVVFSLFLTLMALVILTFSCSDYKIGFFYFPTQDQCWWTKKDNLVRNPGVCVNYNIFITIAAFPWQVFAKLVQLLFLQVFPLKGVKDILFVTFSLGLLAKNIKSPLPSSIQTWCAFVVFRCFYYCNIQVLQNSIGNGNTASFDFLMQPTAINSF